MLEEMTWEQKVQDKSDVSGGVVRDR
jgi:hypothetical protein